MPSSKKRLPDKAIPAGASPTQWNLGSSIHWIILSAWIKISLNGPSRRSLLFLFFLPQAGLIAGMWCCLARFSALPLAIFFTGIMTGASARVFIWSFRLPDSAYCSRIPEHTSFNKKGFWPVDSRQTDQRTHNGGSCFLCTIRHVLQCAGIIQAVQQRLLGERVQSSRHGEAERCSGNHPFNSFWALATWIVVSGYLQSWSWLW